MGHKLEGTHATAVLDALIKAERLITAYQRQRAVDGRHGRDYDGAEHWRFERHITRLEAARALAAPVVTRVVDVSGGVFGQ